MSSNEKMVPERLAAPDVSTGHPGAGREFATAFYKERARADALAGILAQKSEQPHGDPVALPEPCGDLLPLERDGWNACLDEIAKLGPLYTHPDAGEAERLRYKAELYDEVWELATGLGYMNVTTAISTMRAQLAERDSLLRKVQETLQREYWDQYAGLDETRDLIDAALSASAVPSAPVERDGWVSVTERKPEYDKVVLVAFDNHEGKNYTTAHLANQKRCSDPRSTEHDEVWFVQVSGGHRLKTVTHWREIDRAALERKP